MMKRQNLLSQENIRGSLAPLLKERDLQLVILFGSTATGASHKHSDIDLGFLFDQPVLDLTNRVITLRYNNNWKSIKVLAPRRDLPIPKRQKNVLTF
jgi:predicted nucleotidyltransferase